jgi:arylsulfatase A-like enzyme
LFQTRYDISENNARITMKNQPNILFFFTDQQRWDTSGLHGNPLDLTPNFDRMAQRGTHLDYMFTPQPVCGPARACLQTGTYATTNGCYRNNIALPSNTTTMAHYFGSAGYETAYIGKWHLADHKSPGPVAQEQRGGYNYWLAANQVEFTSDSYHAVLYNNENEEVRLPGYRVDALTDAAIRYIATPRENPFFLFLSFLEPHHQNHIDDYPPPDGYRERYAGKWIPPDLAALEGSSHQHLGGYYGMVKRLDEALGRILDAIKSLNMLDNTIVVFTSDHGCHFKTRNDEYKRSCHDSSIRVLGAIQGPGFNCGGKINNLISLIDLPPTLLDAAGIPVSADMQGRSILPLLNHQETSWPEEVFIQISESQVGRAVRTHRWKYGVTAPETDGWNDSSSDHYVESYLYDLLSDPYELSNLIELSSHSEVARVMGERLIRRMVAAGERAPTIESVPKHTYKKRAVSANELYD